MRTMTLSGTSNSGTILSVGTPDSSTGRRTKSTTSIWNSRSQRELTVNQLSGKLGADHGSRRCCTRTLLLPTRVACWDPRAPLLSGAQARTAVRPSCAEFMEPRGCARHCRAPSRCPVDRLHWSATQLPAHHADGMIQRLLPATPPPTLARQTIQAPNGPESFRLSKSRMCAMRRVRDCVAVVDVVAGYRPSGYRTWDLSPERRNSSRCTIAG